MIPLTDPAVASTRLLFHDERALEDRDPQLLASRLSHHYSLLDFGPRPGFERTFLHRSTVTKLGELVLTGGYSSPVQGAMGETPEVAAVNICCTGNIDYLIDRRCLRIDQSIPLFYSSGMEYSYNSGHFNGLIFHLDRKRLIATAAAMAGFGPSLLKFEAQVEAPRVFAFDRRRNERLIRFLLRVFALLDDPYPDFPAELSCLGIDDLVYRTLAQLLCPRLTAVQDNQHSDAAISREAIFNDLLEWLRSDLTTSVSLTAMEQRTGYSRRTLQLAFHQRFGCGPVQWVRRQRLEQVRQALLDPSAGETVSSIAVRFGYSSLGALSRDFSARYGQRPSDLLRLSKRSSCSADS